MDKQLGLDGMDERLTGLAMELDESDKPGLDRDWDNGLRTQGGPVVSVLLLTLNIRYEIQQQTKKSTSCVHCRSTPDVNTVSRTIINSQVGQYHLPNVVRDDVYGPKSKSQIYFDRINFKVALSATHSLQMGG